MKLVLEKIEVLGQARYKYLAQDAARALRQMQKEINGISYTDMWRDPITQLEKNRLHPELPALGYDGHSYGMTISIDIHSIDRQVGYDRALLVFKKHGWHCHRRDGQIGNLCEQFHFFGEFAERYLVKASFDPETWNRPVEEYIYSKYGMEFQKDLRTAQTFLAKAGLYRGEASGSLDAYTREALMAFQRTWRLPETGQADAALCRVLTLVTCQVELSSPPAM